MPTVVRAVNRETHIRLVRAGSKFDSERSHTLFRKKLRAQSVISAKRRKKNWRVDGVRAAMRGAFPLRVYRRRALVETLFSSVMRKVSAGALGRTMEMQMHQALGLDLAYNIYRV